MVFWVAVEIVAWFLVGYLNVRFIYWYDKKYFNAGSFNKPLEVYLLILAGLFGAVLVVLAFFIILASKIAYAIHGHVKSISS